MSECNCPKCAAARKMGFSECEEASSALAEDLRPVIQNYLSDWMSKRYPEKAATTEEFFPLCVILKEALIVASAAVCEHLSLPTEHDLEDRVAIAIMDTSLFNEVRVRNTIPEPDPASVVPYKKFETVN